MGLGSLIVLTVIAGIGEKEARITCGTWSLEMWLSFMARRVGAIGVPWGVGATTEKICFSRGVLGARGIFSEGSVGGCLGRFLACEK